MDFAVFSGVAVGGSVGLLYGLLEGNEYKYVFPKYSSSVPPTDSLHSGTGR
jgi:hypothetical protein